MKYTHAGIFIGTFLGTLIFQLGIKPMMEEEPKPTTVIEKVVTKPTITIVDDLEDIKTKINYHRRSSTAYSTMILSNTLLTTDVHMGIVEEFNGDGVDRVRIEVKNNTTTITIASNKNVQ